MLVRIIKPNYIHKVRTFIKNNASACANGNAYAWVKSNGYASAKAVLN